MSIHDLLRVLHVVAVVFMAAPLYNLIVVNERVSFGPAHLQVDQYFENIIRGNSTRCFAFQATALVTGLFLTALGGSFMSVFTNWVLSIKLLLLLALMSLLSFVHFSIQPEIDRLLGQAAGDAIAAPFAAQIAPLRLRRKRLASVCLFLVMTTVVLGLQVYSRFAAMTTILLLGLAAVFTWRVYRTRIRYGWL